MDYPTRPQKTALRNVCLLAGETVHPRFRHPAGPGASLVLTINAGYE